MQTSTEQVPHLWNDLRAGQALAGRDRRAGMAALNQLYRSGSPPETPLDGRYEGKLLALDIAPGLTQLVEAITAGWMPWKGKTFDADRTVLKIDYDLDGNPAPTIRRVLDELVQLGEGLYLGKAYVHWWWGRWQLVAYFSLATPPR